MTEKISFQETDALQSACRRSFFYFCQNFAEVIIPEVMIWEWYHQLICEELEEAAFRVFKRKKRKKDILINVPPGTTKSTICSILYPVWIWTFFPEARFLCFSYEQSLSLTFARKSRDIVRSKKYQETFKFKLVPVIAQDPKTGENKRMMRWRASTDADAVPLSIKKDVDAKGMYENTMQGDRKSIGVAGQAMGSHSHFILGDDPLNPKVSVSKKKLEGVVSFFDDTLPTRKVDKAVTLTVLIMQRLHQGDPAGHWLKQDEAREKKMIKHICLPATLKPGSVISPDVAVFQYKKNGGFLDPTRLNQEILDEALGKLGKYGYAGQFDQSPMPLSGGIFDTSKICFGIPPQEQFFVKIVRYWDKAGTKDGTARTAGVKMGQDKNGKIWVLHAVFGQWGTGERNKIMRQTAMADGIRVKIFVEQEPGSGGKESAEYSIGTVFAGFSCTRDLPKGSKDERAEPFAGQMALDEKVWIPENSPWAIEYIDELRFFPKALTRDMVDASSGAYGRLSGITGKRRGVLFDPKKGMRNALQITRG